MFSEEVCNKIGNYVYRLIDPRNGETFYVGKGRDNRVFQQSLGTHQLVACGVVDNIQDTYLLRAVL